MSVKENTLEKKIASHLNSLPNSWAVKYPNNEYGTAGFPDRICCYKGTVFFLEVKREGEKPRANQKVWIMKLNKTINCKAYWVDSWQSFMEVLDNV